MSRCPPEKQLVPQWNRKQALRLKTVQTPLGLSALVWGMRGNTPRIFRIFLSSGDETAVERAHKAFADIAESSCRGVDNLAADIRSFLAGSAVTFDRSMLDFDRLPPFQRNVLDTESTIPRGQVASYRVLAEAVGSQGGARAVGNALARNPFPIVIPCHRAVRSDGSLGGFQGGLPMKRRLLEMEGVAFTSSGTVAEDRFHFFPGILTHARSVASKHNR